MDFCLGKVVRPNVFSYYNSPNVFVEDKSKAHVFKTRDEALNVQKTLEGYNIIPYSKGEFVGG